jgi:hypothetical protein
VFNTNSINRIFSTTNTQARRILKTFIFSMALAAQSGPWPLIQFHNHFSQTVGLLGRVIRSPQDRYLITGQHKNRINAYTQKTFMPRVPFEPMITASKRAKTFYALDPSKYYVLGLFAFQFAISKNVPHPNSACSPYFTLLCKCSLHHSFLGFPFALCKCRIRFTTALIFEKTKEL